MRDEGYPNIVDQAIGFPGWILDLQIDLFRSTITYRIRGPYGKEHHTVVFSGVSSFYYTRGEGTTRFEEPYHELFGDTWAVSEWTSARYYPNGVGVANVEGALGSIESQWVGRHATTPNFAIEQLAGTFFIEASRVQVDDQVFEVGYPPILSNEDGNTTGRDES